MSAGLPLEFRSERMAEPRPKRERAAAKGPGEGMHEDAASSTDSLSGHGQIKDRIEAQRGREPTRFMRVPPRATVDTKQIQADGDASRIEVSKVKTVRFKKGVSARAMLHQIQLVPDPRGRVKLLLQARRVRAEKMSVLNAESAFGKTLALNLCGDEKKFQDDQIQRRLKTLQEEDDLFAKELVQQFRAHFPGNEAMTYYTMWSEEEAAPPAELGLGLGYYPSAKKQRGEGSSRD